MISSCLEHMQAQLQVIRLTEALSMIWQCIKVYNPDEPDATPLAAPDDMGIRSLYMRSAKILANPYSAERDLPPLAVPSPDVAEQMSATLSFLQPLESRPVFTTQEIGHFMQLIVNNGILVKYNDPTP